MLFDLRGSGRRRTVKIVYITLAFLMGGGLVLFGIGGGGGISGGLVDAITERSGGSDTSADRFTKQEKAALAKTQANPQDAAAWAALARARFQLAGSGANFDAAKSTFTKKGIAQLNSAGDAWERYLALNPKKPDDRVASLMVQAFGALNKPDKAAEAQEVITEARPTAVDLRGPRDLRLPGRPDPQGRPRQEQGARAHRPGHARGPQGPARLGQAVGGRRGGPAQRDPVASFYTCASALVAQLAEQRTLNPKVPGSIPGGGIEQRPRSRAFRVFGTSRRSASEHRDLRSAAEAARRDVERRARRGERQERGARDHGRG